MLKKLVPVQGGMAVVIDIPLLAIVGAEGATELDLSTDGTRLILSPVRGARRDVHEAPTPVRPNATAGEYDCDDPKETLRVIRELQEKHGFTQEHFRKLHHFGPKASLQAHINYCAGTGRFRSVTNAIVCQRLFMCLALLDDGASWDLAIERARAEFPFPK